MHNDEQNELALSLRVCLVVCISIADGVRADGVRADGVRADGVRADGVRADGVRADGVRAYTQRLP